MRVFRIQLRLELVPMTVMETCICCKLSRGCKGCCRTCKDECNILRDCELGINRRLGIQPDSSWWNSWLHTINGWDVETNWIKDVLSEKEYNYLVNLNSK